MKIKLKTKKAAAKRFKITSTGKVMRNQMGKRHLLEHKSSSSKRQKRNALVVNKSDVTLVKEMLPGAF
jgi:large subunit ribosomal protein L35